MKTYKPSSPGRRGMTGFDFTEVTKGKKPEKSLLEPTHSTGIARTRASIALTASAAITRLGWLRMS